MKPRRRSRRYSSMLSLPAMITRCSGPVRVREIMVSRMWPAVEVELP
jgi:hypothetical protein